MIKPESFHIFTMGPAGWVERGVLHFPVDFFTQTLDLAPYLPDAQGLYRVRLIQKGLGPARIGDLEILSGSVERPPDTLTWVNNGQDLLPVLSPIPTVAPDVFGGTIDAQWNAPPQGQDITLVMNALEGGSCNEDLAVNQTPVFIGGKVDNPAASVVLNDQSVFVQADGSFGNYVDLQDGPNTVTATATDPDGNSSTRTIQVTLDQTAPVITLDGPAIATVSDPIQTITGMVDDPTVRLVTAELNTGTTHDLSVINGQFSFSAVLLPGENDITFSASDSVGNVGQVIAILILDNPNLATLAGEVTDAIYGDPLSGVQVVVTDPQRVWNDVTDDFGEFAYPVTAGAYTAVVHLDGYVDQQLAGATVAGTAPFLDIQLVPVNPSAPLLSGISLSDITDRSGVVHWSTDQPAETMIAYGPTTNYGSTITVPRSYAGSFAQLLDGLPSGTTIHFQITVTNAIGLSSSSGDLTFTTDAPTLATPSVNPFSPPFTRLGTTTATGTAPEGTQIQLYVNGIRQLVGVISGGLFSAPISVFPGLNTIAARAVDGLGNVSPLSAPVPLTFDTAPPYLTRLTLLLGSLDLLTSESDLAGTTNKPGSTVRLVIDGRTDAADQTVADSVGNFCFCHLFLNAGSHEFSLTLTDIAGNVSISGNGIFDFTIHPLSASIGAAPPSVTPLDPRLDPIDSPRAPGTVDISGQAYATGTGSPFLVEIFLDGNVIGTVSTDMSGHFVWPNVALTTGTHVLQARQLPAQIMQNYITVTTNPSKLVQETIVVMDSPPPLPAVTVLVPADGGATNVNELPIRGTVSDPAAVLTTANGRPSAPGTVTSAGGSFLSDYTVALHPGDNPITVIATGSGGAQSSKTVHVSLHPLEPMPAVTVTDPPTDNIFTSSPISVSGSADPVLGGDAIGLVVVEKAPLISAGGPFTASVDLDQRYSPPQLIVWAQDQAGKIGRGQIQAYYQPPVVPSISITSPIPQADLTTSPITVTGVFANAASVSVNGVQAVLGGGTFTADGIILNPGINTLTAIATGAGGQATAQVNVIFSPGSAILTGIVTDAVTGFPIAGATITITDSTTGTTTAVQTDATGQFTATIVPGDFDLTVAQAGYTTAAVHGTANGSQVLNLIFSLTPVPTSGEVAGTVTDANTGLPLSQASVSVVDSNSHPFSAQTGSNGNYAITGLAPGAFTITVSRSGYAQATGNGSVPMGGVAIFSPALQPASTPNNPVPQATALSPSYILAGSGDFVLTVSGSNFVNTAVIHFNNQALVTNFVSGSKLVAVVPASLVTPAGNYPVNVFNPTPGGGISNNLIFTVNNPGPFMDLNITEPLDGSTVTQPRILVRGAFSTNLEEFGMTVNGVVAQVDGNVFVANHVPIAPGDNTITVVGTVWDGTQYQKTITVFGQPDTAYIELTSNFESGISPLTITLTAETFLSSPVASSYLAYTGPATAAVAFVSTTQYNVTMNTEGLYVFTLYVTDTQGRTYQDSVAINVLSLTAIDTLLKSKWNGFKTALSGGDIGGAMKYLTPGAQARYQSALQSLQSQLPQIMASLPDISLSETGEGTASYVITRSQGGQNRIYILDFSQDAQGLWKIQSF
ncbi:MAG: carboxypeptidase regulatory-like domain-containing protein [Nitrospirae bacterium]|nr:carboxypeptidase regulatory-like domain-containing protein [Nitrospirota bacterium]